MAKASISTIQACGVVGAGGAGFPTYVKLSGKADTVLLNAAECEPLLHKDKEVLKNFAPQVIEGLAIAMESVGAAKAVIGIKEKYHDLIDQLKPMLPGGMSICPLADVYPAGDEFILVYNILGRIIPPGGIPLNVGAVVINVETAYNLCRAAAGNAPVIEKFVSVAGAVAQPQTLRVPLGVSLRECVDAAGGPTVSDPNYVIGGVMMGFLEVDLARPVDRTTGAVIVLPSNHVVVRRRRQDWRSVQRVGRSACDQCSFCTELCPRYLLGHPVEPHRAMRALGFNMMGQANYVGSAFCCECNLCSMYSCPESLSPREVCGEFKRRLAKEGVKWQNPPLSATRAKMHLNNRQAPMRRLIARLDLRRFNNVGPLRDGLLPARRVGIRLKQHVGAACVATVAVGQAVQAGQAVGQVPPSDGKPNLGVPVHASISGVVTGIENGIVWIEARG
jgi:Na+-translocating ferredoxin:NAD+ oxidoreductase RnfC subunit